MKSKNDNSNMLLFTESDAAKGKNLAKVDGVAYSGGFVKQPWDVRNIIVDLAGMEFAPQIPLLLSHYNEPNARLGVVVPTVINNQLAITGGIGTNTLEGKDIVNRGRQYEWQLSIGAEVLEAVGVKPDEKITVNGRELEGGFLCVTKSRLREVSVVAVGADPCTSLQIAASLLINKSSNQTKGVKGMKKELIEFIRAKYSLGADCDETAVRAHLDSVGSSVEAEEAAMKIKAAKPAKPVEVKAECVPAMTSEQINAAAKVAAENAVKMARDAENARIEAVKNLTAEFPDLREKAIASGWSKDYTQSVVDGVKAAMNGIPQTQGNIIMRSGPTVDAKSLEAALCLQCGISESMIEASCGKQALDIADSHLRGISLKNVVMESARLSGKSVGVGFSNDTIRAGFSSADLGGILSNVANKKALQAFQVQESIAEKLCSAGDLADFKEAERYRLTDIGDLELVTEGGEIKSGSLGEEKATNKIDTYGKTFTLTRQMIYNDDLGEFLKIPAAMGNRAKRKIDQVFFARLLANPKQADGKNLFDKAHLNFANGQDTKLGVESLEKAIAMFLDQVDGDGQPIAVAPKYLLVPTVLYPAAQRLTMSAVLMGGQTVLPAQNIISNYGLTPVASPYLANSKYANKSETGFYLFADPSQVDTFEIGYFQGRRVPTVEKGTTDFDTLGMAFRVYFDFGVREQDHRGMVFFKGAA